MPAYHPLGSPKAAASCAAAVGAAAAGASAAAGAVPNTKADGAAGAAATAAGATPNENDEAAAGATPNVKADFVGAGADFMLTGVPLRFARFAGGADFGALSDPALSGFKGCARASARKLELCGQGFAGASAARTHRGFSQLMQTAVVGSALCVKHTLHFHPCACFSTQLPQQACCAAIF